MLRDKICIQNAWRLKERYDIRYILFYDHVISPVLCDGNVWLQY